MSGKSAGKAGSEAPSEGFGYAALAAAARQILQENTLPRVLQAICQEACRVMGGESALVFQADPGNGSGRRVLFNHNVPPAFVDEMEDGGMASSIGRSLRRGEVEILQNSAGSRLASGRQTACLVPIGSGGSPFGGLLIYHSSPREYGPDDIALARAFGGLASLAVEKVHVTSTLEARLKEQKSLQRALRHITSGSAVDEVVQAVLAESERVMGTDRCSVILADARTGAPRNYVSQGLSSEFLGRLSALPEPFPIGRSYLSDPSLDEPTIVRRISPRATYGPVHLGEGHRALAAFPLRVGGRNIGALFYFWTRPEALNEHTIALGKAFADGVALSLEKARLISETKERSSRLEIVGKVAKAVSSSLEPDGVFRIIAQEIRSAIPCDRVVIGSFNLEEMAYHRFFEFSDQPMGMPTPEEIEAGRDLAVELYRHKRPQVIPDVLDSPWTGIRYAKAGYRSILAAPIIQEEEVIAHVRLASRRPGAFTWEHKELLLAATDHLGTAIRNAQIHRSAASRAARLAALNELNQKITENLDLFEVLGNIAEAAVKLLGGDHAQIFLLEEDAQKMRRRAASGRIPVPSWDSFQIGEGITGEMVRSGRPVIVHDLIERSFPSAIEWLKTQGLRSYAGHPLRRGGEIIGAITCLSCQEEYFTEEDLTLMGALASQAAVAIQNARLHDEAQRHRDFFRSVVDDNADAIIVTGPDRKVIHWNRGAERLFGYREEETLNRDVVELISPGRPDEEWGKEEGDLIQLGKPIRYEAERVRKDGSFVPVSITLSPVRGRDGSVTAISGIFKDLTSAKRSEEELLAAKEEAESASRTKSEFLSIVSHELRSPLSSIIGFSDILLMETEDEEARGLASKIRNAGLHLNRIVEDLNDLDRIESRKVKLNLEEVPLNALIENLTGLRYASLPEGFRLEKELDPDCGTIVCDPTRINQVLINLIDNAIKYSPAGGTIRISSQARNGEVRVRVQDQGIGISPRDHEVIFERFRQLDVGYRRGAGGLGIGLSLTRSLMALHGGSVRLESSEGKGSVFTINFPRGGAEKPPPSAAGEPDSALPSSEDPWSGLRVLVVDDLKTFHELMKALMKSAAEVRSAYNGEEGVESARAQRPDLILMDLRMPVLDGIEAIARLRADPATKKIPILAVTAQATEEDRQRSLAAGADGFLTKPVNFKKLRQEVLRTLP